jgi:hypothetical protein
MFIGVMVACGDLEREGEVIAVTRVVVLGKEEGMDEYKDPLRKG